MIRTKTTSVVHTCLFAILAAIAVAPLACGGNKPNANASFSLGNDAGAPAASNCAPGQLCSAPPPNCAPGQPCPPPASNCPPGQVCPAAPAASASACPPGQQCSPIDPNLLGGLMGAASALLTPMGQGDPVELGIKAAAARYAPGMTPEGQMAKGNVQTGGHVQFIVNMDAAHCYTVVGFGAGVTEVDLTLLAPPLYNLSAGQDSMTGPTAVIGAAPKPLCPAIPLAIPYKIDIYAKVGAGAVGAQVYSKPK